LTIEDQGTFHYVYSPYPEPTLDIEPGTVVTVETHDAFEGRIDRVMENPSAALNFPFLNPQTGPINVRGAEKGDALAVRILSIRPRGPQPVGTCCILTEFGGLVGTKDTALLNAPLAEKVRKFRVDERGVHWSDNLVLPFEPFIGTIGTAPQIEAISALQPDYYGGNMDLPDVAPGNIIYLPVNRAGGYLYVGDCHAIQGDGELCGVALEIPATVELQIDLIKDYGNSWPQIETPDRIMFVGSARPMEDAARIAYRELVRFVAAESGRSEADAYMLLSLCGKLRVGNMVDPKYSLAASIEKRFLKPD
jgi:acetamidase/formamidase